MSVYSRRICYKAVHSSRHAMLFLVGVHVGIHVGKYMQVYMYPYNCRTCYQAVRGEIHVDHSRTCTVQGLTKLPDLRMRTLMRQHADVAYMSTIVSPVSSAGASICTHQRQRCVAACAQRTCLCVRARVSTAYSYL